MSEPFSITIPAGTDNLTRTLIQKLTKTLKDMNGNITDIKIRMDTMKDEIMGEVGAAKDMAEEALGVAKGNKDTIDELKLQMEQLQISCVGLVDENLKLKKQSNYLDNYGRRNNLVLRGIKEDKEETSDICLGLTKSFLKTNLKMNVQYVDSLDIVRCHRLGGHRGAGYIRPIIVRFQRFHDRQLVWAERFNLANTTYSLHENFSNETEYNRRKLYPLLAAAKKNENYKKTFINIDKLRIDDTEYSVDTIGDLPKDIHPSNLAHKTDSGGKFLVFGGIHSDHYFLSNYYKLHDKMVVDGVEFPSLEHSYQHEKALYFLDRQNALKIRGAKEPGDAKLFGKNVANFKEKEWNRQQKPTMLRLLRIKFKPGSELAAQLLATGDQVLAEAGSSKTFSIGLPLSSHDIYKKKSWKGDNLLGKCLQTIRNELKQK